MTFGPIVLDPMALASLLVSVVALGVGYYAITRGDKNGSSASLIALTEALRQAWGRFLLAEGEAHRHHEFADLANLLEIACALELDRAFKGKPREILHEYLESVITMLSQDEDARNRLGLLKGRETTFKYISEYFRTHCKVPPNSGEIGAQSQRIEG